MGTRSNIILNDGLSQLIFYRHHDGYPEGIPPTLTKFLGLVKAGTIRNNVSQAAAWLTLIGAVEIQAEGFEFAKAPERIGWLPQGQNDWKVSTYEITDDIHRDAEFLYTINLATGKLDTLDLVARRAAYDSFERDYGSYWPHAFCKFGFDWS